MTFTVEAMLKSSVSKITPKMLSGYSRSHTLYSQKALFKVIVQETNKKQLGANVLSGRRDVGLTRYAVGY